MALETLIDLRRLYDPYRNEKQKLFHQAPQTYKLFGGAIGGGKTAAVINEGIQLSLDYPGNFGLLLRKTWPSFRDTVLPQLEKFLPRSLVASWNQTDKLIILRNASKIRYGGLGDDPEDWRKLMSGEYGWIALDQAEEFTENEFLMLATRLRLKVPRRFFLLTCNPTQGWLKKRFIEQSLPDHVFIQALPQDNIKNLPPDYIEKMRQILPPSLQKAYLEGDWAAIQEPDEVFPYLKVYEAFHRHLEPTPPVELGVDVARQGDDRTAIALRRGPKLELLGSYKGFDTMRTCGEIWHLIREVVVPQAGYAAFNIVIKVDADGLGAGVVDRLQEEVPLKEEWLKERLRSIIPGLSLEPKISVIEVHSAARPRDPSKFKNLRAELYWEFREALDQIEIKAPSEIISQFVSIKYKINSAGQIEIEPKEQIKKRLGRSPDEAEALIYAMANLKRRPGRIITADGLENKSEAGGRKDGKRKGRVFIAD